MQTCGEYLVQLLEAYGVELIFGIPGVHTVELYRGLSRTKIRHITPRHEQGAGFMADGYARVTGKPGVCFIVTGPGMTNIATAMGQAFSDSIPMLVISAVNDRASLGMGQGRLHELPSQRALTAGVSVFSHTLLDSVQLPDILAKAFAVFGSQRPGPVHIEIPLDVIVSEVKSEGPKLRCLPSRAAPDPEFIKRASEILTKAKRALIVAGGGAADAASQIRQIAEILDAPVFMTINGKGILPPHHPLALIGNLAMEPLANELKDADVVLAIGTEFGETEMYPEPRPIEIGGALIRVDIDALMLATGSYATIPIVADAKLASAALISALGDHKSTPEMPGSVRAAAIQRAVAAGLWPACRTHQGLLGIIAKVLPDVVIAGDQTEPVYAANQFYQAPRPRSYFNASTGYGTLGYGMPAAFGVKLGVPKRPVVCLIGDGGLQFTLSELATGVEANIAVAIVVWNNQGYGEIKNFMIERNIPPVGVDIYTPDFIGVAKSMGCAAFLPATISELESELANSGLRHTPTVIEIRADSPLALALADAG